MIKKIVTKINSTLTYATPFLMANLEPTKAPTIIDIPIGIP